MPFPRRSRDVKRVNKGPERVVAVVVSTSTFDERTIQVTPVHVPSAVYITDGAGNSMVVLAQTGPVVTCAVEFVGRPFG